MSRIVATMTAAVLLTLAGTAHSAMTLQATSDLSFGQVISGGTGSIILAPNGGRSATGAAMVGSGLGASAATFTVTGPASTAYGIVLPDSVTLSGGGDTLTVDTFTSDPADTGALDPSGTETLRVGATLHTTGGQQSGPYSGLFVVTLVYN